MINFFDIETDEQLKARYDDWVKTRHVGIVHYVPMLTFEEWLMGEIRSHARLANDLIRKARETIKELEIKRVTVYKSNKFP